MQSVYDQTKEIIMGMLCEYDESAGNKTLPAAARITAERIMNLIDRQGYKHDPKYEEALKKVQRIAKDAMDKLPARWNDGFRCGLKQAIPYEKELIEALAAERKARQDDNAILTADNLRLEEALQQCIDWANAYPVDIFPQPTPEQVDAVCKTLGFRIDSISAMVLRNYTGRIGEIARGALSR